MPRAQKAESTKWYAWEIKYLSSVEMPFTVSGILDSKLTLAGNVESVKFLLLLIKN